MEKKKSQIDAGLYTIMCILSFGTVWLIRIIITTAIREAFKDEE